MSAINSEYSNRDRFIKPYLTSCARTFRAGTFDFYIGPDEIQFSLYKNLISRYSGPLGRMMANGMKESREGKAFLKDIDPDTFCRFAEFIHSGDYSAVAPVEVTLTPEDNDILPDDPVPPSPPPEPELIHVPEPEPESAAEPSYDAPPADPPPETVYEDGWGGWGSSLSRNEKKKKKKAKARATPPPPPLPFPVDSAPGLNQSPTMSYAQTFACHISVYHFAEFYLVSGLKELASQKLSEALNIFQCFPERTEDICHVVRLVYNHEDGNTHPSPLHDIVSNYTTNNFRVLTASRRFNDLLAEGGLFPPDLCRKVARLLD